MQLFEAAKNGKIDEILDLIKNGIDLNVRNDLDETPLYVASKNGTYIFYSISNHSVPYRLSATKTCWFLGHANVVEVLADNGAYLCARSNSSFTPLMAAIGNGRESVVDVLLEYQSNETLVDENCTGNDIDSLLLFAISTSK